MLKPRFILERFFFSLCLFSKCKFKAEFSITKTMFYSRFKINIEIVIRGVDPVRARRRRPSSSANEGGKIGLALSVFQTLFISIGYKRTAKNYYKYINIARKC